MWQSVMRSIIIVFLLGVLAASAHAQLPPSLIVEREVQGPPYMRILSLIGISDFGVARSAAQWHLRQGNAGGFLFDFGEGPLIFETGGLFVQTRGIRNSEEVFEIGTWGAPLLAKGVWQLHPRVGLFAKGGVMPFWRVENIGQTEAMGTLGVGAAWKLTRDWSAVLDASYNGMIAAHDTPWGYQGYAVMIGLSFAVSSLLSPVGGMGDL